MDKRNDPLQQQKDRESKIYNQKAEVKTKELKESTGAPSIDPLSRKMAELLTQNELASLGIQPTEAPAKKPTFTIPKSPPAKPSKSAVKKAVQDGPVKGRQESKIEEPEPTPQPESKEKTPVPDMPQSKPGQVEEVGLESKPVEEKKDEMINNMENIQAFQAELQREYPELALNEDAEGSSFHTNELNELEEACKDMNLENNTKSHISPVMPEPQADTKPSEPSPINGVNGKTDDFVSDKTEYEKPGSLNAPKKKSMPRLLNPHAPSSIDHVPQLSSLSDKKNAELFDICSTLLKGKTEATTVTCRTPDIIRRQSLKLQESATKATFLHLNPVTVGRYTPRCHINLTNCKSSPIFFSFRVPADSKMKSENGFASADSLRHRLLKNLLEKMPDEEDFYSKNLSWLHGKEEKLAKVRESQKDRELDGCTFDPYFERHEAQRIKDEIPDYHAVLRADLEKTNSSNQEIRIPETTLKYIQLSPADQQVRYSQGFNFDKLLDSGKIMVSYQSINHLK